MSHQNVHFVGRRSSFQDITFSCLSSHLTGFSFSFSFNVSPLLTYLLKLESLALFFFSIHTFLGKIIQYHGFKYYLMSTISWTQNAYSQLPTCSSTVMLIDVSNLICFPPKNHSTQPAVYYLSWGQIYSFRWLEQKPWSYLWLFFSHSSFLIH